MKQLQAIIAEFHKNRHSKITWITFVAISLGPLFGGVFMYMMKDTGIEGLPGAFRSKAVLMSFEANWSAYLSMLSQAIGIGGVVIFGFITSWLFGREYSEGTNKDLLSLPISRVKIINAKFIYYIFWCVGIAIYNIILGLLIGLVVQIPGWETSFLISNLKIYLITTILVILLNTPVALFAIVGKGYLAPLGFVVLSLILAQIIAALGFGTYFPWSIPGIYSGSGGDELKSMLNIYSYLILAVTSIVGYIATLFYFKESDQT